MLRMRCVCSGTLLLTTILAMHGRDEVAADVYDADWSSLAQRSTPDDPHPDGASWGDTPASPEVVALHDLPAAAAQPSPPWKGDAFVPVGLHNEGNKCYRNSMLQALMACDRFCNNVMQHDESRVSAIYSRSLFAQLKGVLLQASLGSPFQPIIWSFRGGEEEDPHDWFMQAIATDLAPFTKMFTGSMNIDTKCGTPGCPGRSFQYVVAFTSLELEIRRRSNALFALKDWSSDDNAVVWDKCECCHATDIEGCQRARFIYNLPQTLLLQANRFKRSGPSGRLHKDKKQFYAPLQLTGESFAACLPAGSDPLDCIYDLKAIVVHIGNSWRTGHIISYCRHYATWYKCDDSDAVAVCPNEVSNCGDVYLMLYERCGLQQDAVDGPLQPPSTPPPSTPLPSTPPPTLPPPSPPRIRLADHEQCVVDAKGATHCLGIPADRSLNDPEVTRWLKRQGIVL